MNKTLNISLFLLSVVMPVMAQAQHTDSTAATSTTPAKREVFVSVEQMPVFKGPGTIDDFIAQHLHYPAGIVNKDETMTSRLSFIVDTTGNVIEVKIMKSSGSAVLDSEAMRVIPLLKFSPGQQRKWLQFVRYDDVPVVFKYKVDRPQRFTVVEQMPVFKLGNSISDYISDKLVYPEKAYKKKQQGTAYIIFVVSITGEVIEAKVVKSSGYKELDKEAMRVVQLLSFIPAKSKGEPVEVIYEIPIMFSL